MPEAERSERQSLLDQVDHVLEIPMLVLGLAWLVLLVVELLGALSPFLEAVGFAIWAVFVLEFLFRLAVAPARLDYLRSNWLTALSLFLPALRLVRAARALRLLRAARAARGVRVFRVVAAVNRGMRALGSHMSRRGLGYVLSLTLIVALAGAAGIHALEREGGHPELGGDFGTALWWTAMVLATMGSDAWPRTPEGRLLCLFLAVYAFAVFGYVTAALASYFIGRDAVSNPEGGTSLERLRSEIAALRDELRAARHEEARPVPATPSEEEPPAPR